MIGWVIKYPNGSFEVFSIYLKKIYAIQSIEEWKSMDWKTLYKQGYRCVKVKIVEVEK